MDNSWLRSVFDAEISQELLNVHLANVKVLSNGNLTRAEVLTSLLWTTAYFLVDAARDSIHSTEEQDLAVVLSMLDEYTEVLEDTAEKATISMREVDCIVH
jgi:hypothetical protein